MQITLKEYSFDVPERLKDLISVRRKARYTDVVLSWEEGSGYSGLLVRLKCLKRRISELDDFTEYLGTLIDEEGRKLHLYAAYGQEGCVSEENEDLYWRVRDQLYMIFDSITPSEGYSWQPVGES